MNNEYQKFDWAPHTKVNYGYTYPLGLKLRPGTDLHDRLLTEIMELAQESRSFISSRFDSWKQIDRTLTSFIRPDEAERNIKAKDPRKPVSIVIPMTYATLDTFQTLIIQSLMNTDVLLPYAAAQPSTAVGAMLLQQATNQGLLRNKAELDFLTCTRDASAYGLGMSAITWDVKQSPTVTRQKFTRPTIQGLIEYDIVPSVTMRTTAEGNLLTPIDPYTFLPDPHTSVHKIQQSEYLGWCTTDNRLSLLSREQQGTEGLFNCKYIQHCARRSVLSFSDDARSEKSGMSDPSTTNKWVDNTVDVIWIYRTLIPAEYGLSSYQYPQKWVFAVVNDAVIIQAAPYTARHGYYPIMVAAPEYDGYSPCPISRLEMTYGIQETLDWYVNSHTANVRKSINNMLVVDPLRVDLRTLLTDNPHKIILTKRSAWGTGVDGAVQQLDVQDITRGHMVDAGTMLDIFQRISGATSELQGIRREGGERVTAEETRGTRKSALGRIGRVARVIAIQAIRDLAHIAGHNVREFMSEETWVRISYDIQSRLIREYGYNPQAIQQGMVKISREDIDIDFDILPFDGTSSADSDPEVMLRMYETALADPTGTVLPHLDMFRFYLSIARNAGMPNIQEFILSAPDPRMMVQEPEQVLSEVDKGNLVSQEDYNANAPQV